MYLKRKAKLGVVFSASFGAFLVSKGKMDKNNWLIGKKIFMTQVFSPEGVVIPVTVVQLKTDDLSLFNVGDSLSLRAKVKGRGFTGVMKRWGFAGGPATHGSGWNRKPGSIGSTTTPGRVYKGKKMPGRFGGQYQTRKGVKVIKLQKEDSYLYVSGPIPGSKGTQVFIGVDNQQGKANEN